MFPKDFKASRNIKAETIARFSRVMLLDVFDVLFTVGRAIVRAPMTWVGIAATAAVFTLAMAAISKVTRTNLDLLRAEA